MHSLYFKTSSIAFASLIAAIIVQTPLVCAVEGPPARTTGSTSDTKATDTTVQKAKKDTSNADALMRDWANHARLDGKIPGGCIAQLAFGINEFLRMNPTSEQAPAMRAILERITTDRDWDAAEARALIDTTFELSDIPIWQAQHRTAESLVHSGRPLPDDLKSARWGEATPSGLRAAWLFEPRTLQYAHGSILKSRVLFHNSGIHPVIFMTEDWHQTAVHTATDRDGTEIPIWAVDRMGLRSHLVWRLEPDEYCEATGHSIAIAKHDTTLNRNGQFVGAWLEAKVGDEVNFKSGPIQISFRGYTLPRNIRDPDAMWRYLVDTKMQCFAPCPSSPQDRERILRRAMTDLFGKSPTDDELAIFINDQRRDALEQLAQRLHDYNQIQPVAGELPTGTIRFIVTAAQNNQEPKEAKSFPEHEYAKSLFEKWKQFVRTDGRIPGALIGHIKKGIEDYAKQSPDDEKAKQLLALLPRCDANRDWEQAEAAQLLDDVCAIATAPVSWSDLPLQFFSAKLIKTGEPLPDEWKDVAWGKPAVNGLRAAWVLLPRADAYHFGTVLKSKLLYHNSGNRPVYFRTDSWHQNDAHIAKDAQGKEFVVHGVFYTGITLADTYRLEPGEYCEVGGHGIGIGNGDYLEEKSTGNVGAWIDVKPGDEVRFSTTVSESHSNWTKPDDPKDPEALRKKQISERIALELPLPSNVADRELMLSRIFLDLYGIPPNALEVREFVNDQSKEAIDHLARRLEDKEPIKLLADTLPTGETKFRVLAPDPEAMKKPRVARGPGRYILSDRVHLMVQQITSGGERTNRATIAFLSEDPQVPSPHKPYAIALPPGLAPYAMAWQRTVPALWIAEEGAIRKIDFDDPDHVVESRFEGAAIFNVPNEFREALGPALSGRNQ